MGEVYHHWRTFETILLSSKNGRIKVSSSMASSQRGCREEISIYVYFRYWINIMEKFNNSSPSWRHIVKRFTVDEGVSQWKFLTSTPWMFAQIIEKLDKTKGWILYFFHNFLKFYAPFLSRDCSSKAIRRKSGILSEFLRWYRYSRYIIS